MKRLKSFLIVLAAVFAFQAGSSAAAQGNETPADSDALKQLFLALSAETKSEEVDNLAKQYGLYASYCNYGTGTYGYRIAAEKDIADVGTKAKGSYISISFYILQNDAVSEISYFNIDSMTECFWYPDSGYSVVDYNIPQTVIFSVSEDGTENRTCVMPVTSALEAADYVSSGSPEGNLLAQLFLSAHEGMTEEDILTFVRDNSLAYSPNGPGNFKTIAYTEDVAEKYGKSGTQLTFDADDTGLIWMQYSYYPAFYCQGISAAFYSRSYAAFQKFDEGFLLCKTGAKPVQYKDAIRLIQLIHGQTAGK